MAGSYWDAQLNVVEGCTAVSPACARCWAAQVASRFPGAYPGLASDGKWSGKVRLHPERLALPSHWKKPRRVFVANMGDLFHEDVPDAFIQAVFRAIEASPRHLFMVLTKRPRRMREWTRKDRWPSNAYVGVTVENQQAADERIPDLLATSAERKWVSFEPLLSSIVVPRADLQRLNWAVIGCESGRGARPMDEAWVRSLRDHLEAAGVPWLYKQAMDGGRLNHAPLLDGVRYDALPEMTAPERQLRSLQSGDPEML